MLPDTVVTRSRPAKNEVNENSVLGPEIGKRPKNKQKRNEKKSSLELRIVNAALSRHVTRVVGRRGGGDIPVAYPELVSRGVSKSRKFKWLVKVGACKPSNLNKIMAGGGGFPGNQKTPWIRHCIRHEGTSRWKQKGTNTSDKVDRSMTVDK